MPSGVLQAGASAEDPVPPPDSAFAQRLSISCCTFCGFVSAGISARCMKAEPREPRVVTTHSAWGRRCSMDSRASAVFDSPVHACKQ